ALLSQPSNTCGHAAHAADPQGVHRDADRTCATASTATRTKAGGIPVARPALGDPAFSWHLINSLVADEFDITMCQEMLIDHAVTIPLELMWRQLAGEDRADLDQHRADPTAVDGALSQTGTCRRPCDRVLSAGHGIMELLGELRARRARLRSPRPIAALPI